MSQRLVIAQAAMQAILANNTLLKYKTINGNREVIIRTRTADEVAALALEYADALLKHCRTQF